MGARPAATIPVARTNRGFIASIRTCPSRRHVFLHLTVSMASRDWKIPPDQPLQTGMSACIELHPMRFLLPLPLFV